MKQIFLYLFILFSINTVAQNDNPFASIGKVEEVQTLSNGRYEEVFKNEKLRRIGSVMMNTETMKIDHFLSAEELKECQDLEIEKQASRFLSIDPLARSFPFYTPYQYAGNKPIACIDLDGLEEVWINQDEYHFGNYINPAPAIVHLKGTESYERIKKAYMEYMGFVPNDEGTIMTTMQFNNDGEIQNVIEHYRLEKTPTVTAKRPSETEKAIRRSIRTGLMGRTTNEWEGGDNGRLPWEQGKKVMFGTAGVIFSGGTLLLAEGTTLISITGLGLLSSADDMTADRNAQTITSKALGVSQGTVDNAKLVLDIASFTKSTQGLIKKFATEAVENGGSSTRNFSSGELTEFMDIIKTEVGIIDNQTEKLKGKK